MVVLAPGTSLIGAATFTGLGGDVDGDGVSDLLALTTTSFSVYKRTSTGLALIQGPISFAMTQAATFAQLVDWDGDNDLDLFLDNSVWPNAGNGTFGPPSIAVGLSMGLNKPVIDDLDADGDMDMVAFSAGALVVLERNGSALTTSFSIVEAVSPLRNLQVFDVDGDGIKDLFWIPILPPFSSQFAKGLGGCQFQAPMTANVPANYGATGGTAVFIAGDFDGDGRRDLMTAEPMGLFGPPTTFVFGISTTGTLYQLASGLQVLAGYQPFRSAQLTSSLRDEVVALNAPLSSSATFFASSVAPIPHLFSLVSGGGQTATSIDSTPLPIIAQLSDVASGLPVPGVPVTIATSGGMTTVPNGGATTDTFGRVSLTVLGGNATGMQTVTLSTATSANFSIPVLVTAPGVVNVVGGMSQWAFAGGPPLQEIVFEVIRPNGTPLAGAPLQLSATAPLSLPPTANPAVTDAMGRAAVTPTVSGAGYGTVTATLATGPNNSSAVASVAGRRFIVNHGSGSPIISISHFHEDGPTPLVIAADLPRPPVVTPYGDVVTSILAPQPGLVVLDGLGVIGPQNSSIVANPSYTIVATSIPPSLIGTVLVFQSYGFDPSYVAPRDFFVSPGVTRLL